MKIQLSSKIQLKGKSNCKKVFYQKFLLHSKLFLKIKRILWKISRLRKNQFQTISKYAIIFSIISCLIHFLSIKQNLFHTLISIQQPKSKHNENIQIKYYTASFHSSVRRSQTILQATISLTACGGKAQPYLLLQNKMLLRKVLNKEKHSVSKYSRISVAVKVNFHVVPE